jgi:hypothetical protein
MRCFFLIRSENIGKAKYIGWISRIILPEQGNKYTLDKPETSYLEKERGYIIHRPCGGRSFLGIIIISVPPEGEEPDFIGQRDPVVQLDSNIAGNVEHVPLLEPDLGFAGLEDLPAGKIMFVMDPGGG